MYIYLVIVNKLKKIYERNKANYIKIEIKSLKF